MHSLWYLTYAFVRYIHPIKLSRYVRYEIWTTFVWFIFPIPCQYDKCHGNWLTVGPQGTIMQWVRYFLSPAYFAGMFLNLFKSLPWFFFEVEAEVNDIYHIKSLNKCNANACLYFIHNNLALIWLAVHDVYIYIYIYEYIYGYNKYPWFMRWNRKVTPVVSLTIHCLVFIYIAITFSMYCTG